MQHLVIGTVRSKRIHVGENLDKQISSIQLLSIRKNKNEMFKPRIYVTVCVNRENESMAIILDTTLSQESDYNYLLVKKNYY